VTRANRRTLYLIGAGLLVAALVGGRWLAVETTERAWDRTFAGGEAVIAVRDFSRVLQAAVLVLAIGWLTGNLLLVFRAIGSVQMPRRLGDLEIVEAVPRRTLFAATVLLGVALGSVLSLGTGDWWRYALMAASPPHFGVPDSTKLGNDAGYYVSVLPWHAALQNRALILVVGALGIVALLYGVIGSLRFRRGRIRASDHARRHVGVLFACLAVVIAWGAVLDPAETVGGLHGPVDQAALMVRIPGAAVVAAVAIVTAVISLIWTWRDRPKLIQAGWAALLVSLTAAYFVIPGVVRTSTNSESADLVRHRAALEQIAFGLTDLNSTAPPAFPSGEAAVENIPLWDPAHVGVALGAPDTAARVALRAPRAEDGGRGAVWMVAPINTPGPVRFARETDTGFTLTSQPIGNTAPLFGPGLRGSWVTSPDSAPAGAAGIPLTGGWRRFAIAWTIQAWGLARGESSARVLVWRRDVVERLERLAPFARFGTPAPVMRDGALWWVSWGYVSQTAFPLARSLPWHDDEVRFVRAGLVGAVRVGTGETHLWLAQGFDSLTAAWARRFEPLIEPADRLPADIRAQLAVPAETFDIAVSALLRTSGDSALEAGWFARPREPFQLVAPGGLIWTGVGLESGTLTPKKFVGLYAAAITPRGPEAHLWRPSSPEAGRLPGELVGSSQLRPGQLRIWPAGSSIITAQAQILDPIASEPPQTTPPRVAEVYVTIDGRSGHALTARAALLGGEQIVVDTTIGARWERARRLAMQANAALSAGNLELFTQLWRELLGELARAQRPR